MTKEKQRAVKKVSWPSSSIPSLGTRVLLIVFAPVFFCFLSISSAQAHPVPKENHDRQLTIHLQKGKASDHLKVSIEYRLEVDEFTVVWEDMKPFRDEVDPALFARKPLEYYAAYTRIYGDILAANLLVQANGQPVLLKVESRNQTLRDEKDQPLGHLRCDFVFQGEFQIVPNQENQLRLLEGNFHEQKGLIRMAFVNEGSVRVSRQTIPEFEKEESEDNRRILQVRFFPGNSSSPVGNSSEKSAPGKEGDLDHSAEDDDGFMPLFRAVRQSEIGLGLMLLFFAGLGAAHALTPGHGKTLVAAYLVGQRGTIWHAVTLGLVTTITHTGVVLVLALVLFFLPEHLSGPARRAIQTGLGLAMGLVIVCLGFWLLLQRLSGRADHFHVGGEQHHLHPPMEQTHVPVVENRPNEKLGWWGIIVLGMTGGLVPCWDAIVILVAVVGTSEFWLALPALLAFSAGLAGVLVAVGILVVKFRNFAGSRWGEGRFVRSLPLVSALLITAMGFWLCYESVRHP